MYILIRWLVNALAIMLATQMIAGLYVRGFYAALVVALILGFLNAVARPLFVLLTLPLTLVTMGLFIFVINAVLIWFTASIVKGFEVAGFWPAFWLGVYMWTVSLLTSWLLERKSRRTF